MKKKLWSCLSIFIFMLLLFTFSFFTSYKSNYIYEVYSWHGGKCELDNGRLHYIGSGSKEHYICEICGKEYTFDKVETYEKRN